MRRTARILGILAGLAATAVAVPTPASASSPDVSILKVFQLVNGNSGLCATVTETVPGSPVHQSACGSGGSQTWAVRLATGRADTLVWELFGPGGSFTGLCARSGDLVDSRALVQLAKCDPADPRQAFTVTDPRDGDWTNGGSFALVNRHHAGYALDIHNASTQIGAPAAVAPRDPNAKSQRWTTSQR